MDLRILLQCEAKIVVKGNGLQQRPDFVVSVCTLPEDAQVPVDFGERRNGESIGRHLKGG